MPTAELLGGRGLVRRLHDYGAMRELRQALSRPAPHPLVRILQRSDKNGGRPTTPSESKAAHRSQTDVGVRVPQP